MCRCADELVTLLAHCGAIPSTHEYHYNVPRAGLPGRASRSLHGCAAAPVRAFPAAVVRSIDHTTTEIDDAFSVRELANGHHDRDHISAPALAIARGSPLDAVAFASRPSTPGRKITMPPDGGSPRSHWRQAHSARRCPSTPRSQRTERWSAQTRQSRAGRREPGLTARRGVTNERQGRAIRVDRRAPRAVRFAQAQAAARQAPTRRASTTALAPTGTRTGRQGVDRRGARSPLDRVVSELMIFVNSTWGERLRTRAAGLSHAANGGEKRRGRVSIRGWDLRTICGRPPPRPI